MNKIGNSICVLVLSAGVIGMPAGSIINGNNQQAYFITIPERNKVIAEIMEHNQTSHTRRTAELNQLPYLNLIGSIRKVDLPEESSQIGYL